MDENKEVFTTVKLVLKDEAVEGECCSGCLFQPLAKKTRVLSENTCRPPRI